MCKREEPFLELREEQELSGKNCRFQLYRGKHFPAIAAAKTDQLSRERAVRQPFCGNRRGTALDGQFSKSPLTLNFIIDLVTSAWSN